VKTVVPDYYVNFKCVADRCRHTCCQGWEIDVDEDKLALYRDIPYIAAHIDFADVPHFRLEPGERCPFLTENNLCRMIRSFGEDALCRICRDHPQFRNYWSDRVEIGLGLVCEEAGRIILGSSRPMALTVIEDDGGTETPDEAEQWLLQQRQQLLSQAEGSEPEQRLWEYLVYRHVPDALYDGRWRERQQFIRSAYREILSAWGKTDRSFDALAECARVWSYDVEYDEEELEKRIASFTK